MYLSYLLKSILFISCTLSISLQTNHKYKTFNLGVVFGSMDLQGRSNVALQEKYDVGGANREKLHLEALDLYERMRNCSDSYISKPLQSALDVLDDAMRLYGPERLISSFNGGKDAVVVMHLLRAAAAKFSVGKKATVDDFNTVDVNYSPKFIYFVVEDEFPEVLEFINESKERYGLDLVTINGSIAKVCYKYFCCLT